MFAQYEKTYPALAKELLQSINAELPEGWDADIPQYSVGEDKLATRSSSGEVLNALAKNVPQLFGVQLIYPLLIKRC